MNIEELDAHGVTGEHLLNRVHTTVLAMREMPPAEPGTYFVASHVCCDASLLPQEAQDRIAAEVAALKRWSRGFTP